MNNLSLLIIFIFICALISLGGWLYLIFGVTPMSTTINNPFRYEEVLDLPKDIVPPTRMQLLSEQLADYIPYIKNLYPNIPAKVQKLPRP